MFWYRYWNYIKIFYMTSSTRVHEWIWKSLHTELSSVYNQGLKGNIPLSSPTFISKMKWMSDTQATENLKDIWSPARGGRWSRQTKWAEESLLQKRHNRTLTELNGDQLDLGWRCKGSCDWDRQRTSKNLRLIHTLRLETEKARG